MARKPGKGDAALRVNAEIPINTRPNQAVIDRARGENLIAETRGMPATAARRPPTANSHSRVGVTKYAEAGSRKVQTIDTAREPTTKIPIPVAAVTACENRNRRAIHANNPIRSGQMR